MDHRAVNVRISSRLQYDRIENPLGDLGKSGSSDRTIIGKTPPKRYPSADNGEGLGDAMEMLLLQIVRY